MGQTTTATRRRACGVAAVLLSAGEIEALLIAAHAVADSLPAADQEALESAEARLRAALRRCRHGQLGAGAA